MRNLPRRFEFDCKPFGKGLLYIADLDVRDSYGHVEIKYSPNHKEPRSYDLDYVFWGNTEGELEDLIKKDIRRITKDLTKVTLIPNIDDLI